MGLYPLPLDNYRQTEGIVVWRWG